MFYIIVKRLTKCIVNQNFERVYNTFIRSIQNYVNITGYSGAKSSTGSAAGFLVAFHARSPENLGLLKSWTIWKNHFISWEKWYFTSKSSIFPQLCPLCQIKKGAIFPRWILRLLQSIPFQYKARGLRLHSDQFVEPFRGLSWSFSNWSPISSI